MNKIKDIRQSLYQQRYSIRSWAIRNGYKASTVDSVIRRTIAGHKPRGSITKKILVDLSQTVGKHFFKDIEF